MSSEQEAQKWLNEWLWVHSDAETLMPQSGMTEGQMRFTVHALASYALSERLAGMELACKVMCPLCEHREPPTWNGKRWQHVIGIDSSVCRAELIRQKARELRERGEIANG